MSKQKNITDEELREILQVLLHQYGYDFLNYTSASLKRRISHFMDTMRINNIYDLGVARAISQITEPNAFISTPSPGAIEWAANRRTNYSVSGEPTYVIIYGNLPITGEFTDQYQKVVLPAFGQVLRDSHKCE